MSLPRRPTQHQLETASRIAFERALPATWVFRAETLDYGIDGTVEVVSPAGEVTGRRFAVQLKATKATDWGSFGIATKTAEYFRRLSVPVLLVRYRAADDVLLVQWAHDLGFNRKAKSVRVSERAMRRWDAATPAWIKATLDSWDWIRDPALRLPIVVNLDFPHAEFHGHSAHSLARAIEQVAARAPGILKISEIPDQESQGFARFDLDALRVVLPAGCKFTIGIPDSSVARVFTTEQIASDVILAVAVALLQARQLGSARALIRAAAITSSVAGNPSAALTFAAALRTEHDFTTLLHLTRALLERGLLEAAQAYWVLASMTAHDATSAKQEEFLEQSLGLLNYVEALGDSDLAASSHYNIGRFFIQPGPRAREGLRHFRAARRFNPAYLNRDYFWQDVGAVLFESGKYTSAVGAYRRALDLGADSHARATLADSLTWMGCYQAAAREFERYRKDSKSPKAHWLLKGIAQSALIAAAGSSNQRRDTPTARARADIAETATADVKRTELWSDALRADALYTLAWYNLGIAAERSGDHRTGFERFLVAALYAPWDVEAWANTIIAGLNGGLDATAFALVVSVAYQQRGVELYRTLGDLLRKGNEPSHVNDLLSKFKALLSQIPPVQVPRILRIGQPDGSLLVLSSDSESRTDPGAAYGDADTP